MKTISVFLLMATTSVTSLVTAQTCNPDGPLDVKACFGATGNGTTSDTTAIKNALSGCNGAGLYFPAGTYLITSPLTGSGTCRMTGMRYSTAIKAQTGFSGTMLTINTPSSPSPGAVAGGLDSIDFDCNNAAAVGVLYGGSSSNVLYGFETTGVYVNGCTTAGAQVGPNAWELTFVNSAFWGNGGDGFQVLQTTNTGENISFLGADFSNNGGNGLTINNSASDGSAHTVFCFGCSFDYNTGWGVQIGTGASDGDLTFSATGSHLESPQKWIQNYGYITLNGDELTNGSNSATLGYLIDNEGILNWVGGRADQSGEGTVLKAGEAGVTNVYGALVTSPSGVTTFPTGTPNMLIDPYGYTADFDNIHLSGIAALSSVTINGTAGFTGTKTAGSCVFTIQSGVITNVTGC